MRRVLCAVLAALALLLFIVPAAAATDVTVTAVPSYATAEPTVNSTEATGISSSSAVLHGDITDTGGGIITMRGFEWGLQSANYTSSWNETGGFTTGEFSHTISNLTFCTGIFWRAFALNDYGQGNSTEETFTTSCRPSAPTDFTISQAGPSSIIISWTKGQGANTTIIRASADGYPSSVADGYGVYSDNGTSVTIDGFAFDLSASYFRAWSHNEYGYSLDYAEGSVGNPIGISAIVFAVGLCGFALWKKGWIRIVLSLCIIIWGVFAMPYDIKVAAPFISIGAILFIMSISQIITVSREASAEV